MAFTTLLLLLPPNLPQVLERALEANAAESRALAEAHAAHAQRQAEADLQASSAGEAWGRLARLLILCLLGLVVVLYPPRML